MFKCVCVCESIVILFKARIQLLTCNRFSHEQLIQLYEKKRFVVIFRKIILKRTAKQCDSDLTHFDDKCVESMNGFDFLHI